MTPWRTKYNHKFIKAAKICQSFGMVETADSVAEFCIMADDGLLDLISAREIAEEMAEYCGVNTLGYATL
jgi:hypothetical protein